MWIRQLVSLDPVLRRQAFHHLAGSICHQGWISPASAYAVPYLLELVADPSICGRDQILNLVADIAAAGPLREQYWRENEDVPEYNVPAHIPFKDAHAGVASGLDLFLLLLDDENPRIRMETARLLTSFPERAPEIRRRFVTALDEERDPQVRANLLLALGRVSQPVREEWSIIYERFLAREHELVTLAAALALPRLAHEETPQDVADLLAAEMFSLRERLDGYTDMPCGGGNVWSSAMWALYWLGGQRLEFLVLGLRKLLNQHLPEEVVRPYLPAQFLLFIVFQGPLQKPQPSRPAESLTSEQRTVLVDLLPVAALWRFGNFRERLRLFGLPDTRENMVTYLGLTPEEIAEHTPAPHAGPPVAAKTAPQRGITSVTFSPRESGSDDSAASSRRDPFSVYAERIRELAPHLRVHRMQGKVQSADDPSDGVVTVSERYLFRFPHQATRAQELLREIALLRALRGRLPLPIPDPTMSSDEGSAPDQAVLGYEMLPGKPLEREMLESIYPDEAVSRVTTELGEFLQALHAIPVDEMAVQLPVRTSSAAEWEDLYTRIRESLFPLLPDAIRDMITTRFEAFLAQRKPISQCIIHGNFTPQVILYDAKARRVSGIIDFGQAALGDPAMDLATLLGPRGYDEPFARQIE